MMVVCDFGAASVPAKLKQNEANNYLKMGDPRTSSVKSELHMHAEDASKGVKWWVINYATYTIFKVAEGPHKGKLLSYGSDNVNPPTRIYLSHDSTGTGRGEATQRWSVEPVHFSDSWDKQQFTIRAFESSWKVCSSQ